MIRRIHCIQNDAAGRTGGGLVSGRGGLPPTASFVRWLVSGNDAQIVRARCSKTEQYGYLPKTAVACGIVDTRECLNRNGSPKVNVLTPVYSAF
jgi:hypothetical protein